MNQSARKNGLLATIHQFLSTALETARVRLELFATEVEFEKRRLFDALLWGAAAFLALSIGVVLLCGFIILMFAPEYRVAAVGVMGFLFLGTAALLLQQARQRLRNTNSMFDASLSELKKDQALLHGSPENE